MTLYALHAAEFKQRTLAALEIVEGTRAQADETFATLRAMAVRGGLPTSEVARFYKELRATGYQAKEVRDILAAGFDVGAVIGDGGTEAIVRVAAHIKEFGKFDSRELKKVLRGTTIQEDELAATLGTLEGPAKGKSIKAIRAMMEAGQIEAAQGVEAILLTIRKKFDKGGALGTAAIDVGGKSFSGQLQALRNNVDNLFADSVVATPFLDALKNLNELLGGTSETSRALRSTLGAAFASVASVVASIATPGNLVAFVHSLAGLAAFALEAGSALGGGFPEGLTCILKPLLDVFRLTRDGTSGASAFADIFRVVGRVIGWVVGILAYAAIGIGAIVVSIVGFVQMVGAGMAWLADALASFWDWLGSLWKSFKDWGGRLVEGLWDGIKQKWTQLKTWVSGAFTGLVDDTKKLLGIASPSRVFRDIGRFTVAGFVEGVNDNARGVGDAYAGAFATPEIDWGAGGGARAGGAARVSIGDINVHVHVSGGGAVDAAAIGRVAAEAVRRELVGALDEIALSLGGVAA